MSDLLDGPVADTEEVDVFVDQVTTVGSAFGATSDGEAVFIHARIVDYLALRHGDKLRAYVLPNYPDKRHNVPWRVLRATVQGSIFEDISTEVRDAHDEDLEPLEMPADLEPDLEIEELSNADRLVALLEESGPMRTSYIARALDISVTDAVTFCYGLQQDGTLVRADVYSHPSNKRASLRVWALSINDYDEDYDN